MFRFKQPSSGSLPFVLCWSYNSLLKYIVKDGSVVWLHIVSRPCFVCASCIVQNVTAVTFCVYRALGRLWLQSHSVCIVHCAECDCGHILCVSCIVQNVTAITFCVYRALCRMWMQSHSVCIVHCAEWLQSHSVCIVHCAECDCSHILCVSCTGQIVTAVTFCPVRQTHKKRTG